MPDHSSASATTITGTVQHSAWLERNTPPVEQLATDLWSIPVPMETPLRYVSVYVLATDSGLTLIDAGIGTDEAWAALNAGLAGFGAAITDVEGCLVTHQHYDHIGLAGRLREASGAWIALHPADRDALVDPSFRQPAVAREADRRWVTWLGASAEEAVGVDSDERLYAARSMIALPDRLIEDGELVGVKGWSLRAVHTPGHTPGHLCFVDDERRLLFAGDHVLPRISPNITVDRSPKVDALGDFLTSLKKIGTYDVDVDEVLPAHEWRFRGLSERVGQLEIHHERRLAELLAVITDHPGIVPWEMAAHLTWSRPWDQYDGWMRLAAVGETAAHVVHLLRRGQIVATDGQVPRYRCRT